MCNSYSFFVYQSSDGNGLAVKTGNSVDSHGDEGYPGQPYFECEWTDGEIEVRSERNESENDTVRQWLLSQWKNEFHMLNAQIVLRGGKWTGSLNLSGTAITALPDGLSVGGYLDLSGTAITKNNINKKFLRKAIF
jgi:hypothetical protein